MKAWFWAFVAAALTSGCAGTPIRYYQAPVANALLVEPAGATLPVTLAVASFAADLAYDDQRIVYRSSDERFDYYHFHRWSSAPGEMASVVLREALRQSGRFANVVGGLDPRADVVLSGRVVALEEVDVSKDEWQVRVELELTLRGTVTGDVLWNQLVEQTEPVSERTPEGVAKSAGQALTRIAVRVLPAVTAAASRATRK